MSTGSGGPLSPDGRHQWNGTEWVPIPSPPKTTGDKVYNAFKLACVVLVVLVILGILGSLIPE